MHERARARWQVEVLKKRLEEANKSLHADPLVRAEEIKKLRRVVRDKESALDLHSTFLLKTPNNIFIVIKKSVN